MDRINRMDHANSHQKLQKDGPTVVHVGPASRENAERNPVAGRAACRTYAKRKPVDGTASRKYAEGKPRLG